MITLFLMACNLGLGLGRHGKEKEGSYNFWHTFIAIIIHLSLMYFCGVFNYL